MILAASGIDWTTVLVAGITAVPATIAALLGIANRRRLITPSGDPIGAIVERTHDLAAVTTAAVTDGATAKLALSEDRLNVDPESPINTNGETHSEATP